MSGALRDAICRAGASLHARGYAHATAGNISARLPDGRELTDCAWGYASPFDGAAALAGCVSFSGDDVRVLVDGRPAAA